MALYSIFLITSVTVYMVSSVFLLSVCTCSTRPTVYDVRSRNYSVLKQSGNFKTPSRYTLSNLMVCQDNEMMDSYWQLSVENIQLKFVRRKQREMASRRITSACASKRRRRRRWRNWREMSGGGRGAE